MIDTQALRQARKDAGLSRKQAAEAASRSINTIRRYEAGRGCPSLETLAAMAKVYGCQISDFIADDEAVAS